MKILRIIARLNVGGPARHVVWLTKELQDDEFQSVLIAGTIPEGEADMSYFAVENGVEPIYIADLSRELSPRDLFALWKIFKQIKAEKPDIIHTHTAKAGTVGRLAGLMYRWFTWGTLIGRPRQVRIIHTFHGHVFHSYYSKLKTQAFVVIEKLLARIATNRIIVLSDQQLSEINGEFGIGNRNQFEVIPLGIDLSRFSNVDSDRDALRDEIRAQNDEIVVGFVGRLTEIKNISYLLKVASIYLTKLDSQNKKLKFVIVGDGNLRQTLTKECESLGINDIVSFLGHRPDIFDLISGMDVIALTSLNEGTPLSLIEAMAAGKPVISTAVGGVVDLLGAVESEEAGFQICERGVTVTSNSPEDFLHGLNCLAENEQLRKRLADAGKLFVVENYSTHRLVNDMRSLYHGC
ncbi:MAG: glycosyltransferase [Pyrinomonadaceae bacterium]